MTAEPLTIAAALLPALIGMTGLRLSMDRHHRHAFGKPASRLRRLVLRLGGWAALFAAAVLCLACLGWAVGLVAWFGVLTAAALATVFAPARRFSTGSRATVSRATASAAARSTIRTGR